jgi:hypothetical protein
MKINRTSIATGLAIGVLAGGAGGALAATTSSGARSATTSSTTTTTTTTAATSGWTGYGDGWSRGARWRDRPGDGWGQWRHPAPGVGWAGRGTDTTMGGGW